jgi:hypothetical protein
MEVSGQLQPSTPLPLEPIRLEAGCGQGRSESCEEKNISLPESDPHSPVVQLVASPLFLLSQSLIYTVP